MGGILAQQKLGSLSVTLFGGLAKGTFAPPEVSGHARVGAAFSFRVACEWKVESSVGGQAWGTLLVPEFTSETGCKSSIEVVPGEGKKCKGQLVTGFRQEGVAAVKTLLAQFQSELQIFAGC